MFDGLTLAGGCRDDSSTPTDDLGNTFQPVRVRPEHTRLKVMDDEALTHIRMLKPLTDPVPPPVGREDGDEEPRLLRSLLQRHDGCQHP